MAYMSEEGYKKLMAELKELETGGTPEDLCGNSRSPEIKETCLKTLNTMQQKKRKVCSKCVSTN